MAFAGGCRCPEESWSRERRGPRSLCSARRPHRGLGSSYCLPPTRLETPSEGPIACGHPGPALPPATRVFLGVPQFTFYFIFIFIILTDFIYLFMNDREGGRDPGRGRSRLHVGSPTWDPIPDLQDHTPGGRRHSTAEPPGLPNSYNSSKALQAWPDFTMPCHRVSFPSL